MSRKVVVTCAVTGSADTRGRNPNVPVTPAEIAADVLAAAKAGAAVAHIHVRNPETGLEDERIGLFEEVARRVRDSSSDILLNLTSAIGTTVHFDPVNPSRLSPSTKFWAPSDRVAHIQAIRPDICSLDLCTMIYGGEAYINLPEHIRHIAEQARASAVKPECEVFNLGDMVLLKEFVAEGLLDSPPLVQIVLGARYGAPAHIHALLAMLHEMPPNSIWTAFSIGAAALPMAAQSVLLGGHVRVGLEDNLYLSKGVAATNPALVAQAVNMIESLGFQVASPTDTRELLARPHA